MTVLIQISIRPLLQCMWNNIRLSDERLLRRPILPPVRWINRVRWSSVWITASECPGFTSDFSTYVNYTPKALVLAIIYSATDFSVCKSLAGFERPATARLAGGFPYGFYIRLIRHVGCKSHISIMPYLSYLITTVKMCTYILIRY